MRHRRGFTLLELQVALLLLALVAVVMVGALRLAGATWQRVTARQDSGEHQYLLVQALRRHLAEMRFAGMSTADSESLLSFMATDSQLNFVAPMPMFNSENDLYWWTLHSAWQEEAGNYQLLLDYQPFDPGSYLDISHRGELLLVPREEQDVGVEDEDERPPPGRLLVADRTVIKQISYLARDIDDRREWRDTWEPLSRPPLSIHLDLAIVDDDGEETPLPTLVATPRYADQQLQLRGWSP